MLHGSLPGRLLGGSLKSPFVSSCIRRPLCNSLALRSSSNKLNPAEATATEFDELKASSQQLRESRTKATFFDIESLIANSPGLQDAPTFHDKFDKFSFGSSLRNPREVAKSINMFGPPAGRSVDVRSSLGSALLGLRHVLKKDKIKEYQQIQARYIRPAKLRKMKKALWWKRNFREQFHHLMIDIKDAKRRGY